MGIMQSEEYHFLFVSVTPEELQLSLQVSTLVCLAFIGQTLQFQCSLYF